MQKHQTPTTLDLATRVGRFTLGHIAAGFAGSATLALTYRLTAGMHDLGHHFACVVFPTIAVCAPILALTRGGIERYAQQSTGYAVRQAARLLAAAAAVLGRGGMQLVGQLQRRGKEGGHALRTWTRTRAR